MNNSKKWIAVLALALAAAVVWGADKGAWDEGYRRAVEEAVQRAGEGMGSVSPWEGATVAILPIHGDEDGFVSELLKIAMTDAGVACVQLEGDPVWEPIGKQLVWNERSSDILDPETVRLISERTMKSATVLLTGSVRKTTSRTGRVGATLTLHATDVATTVHAWGGVFKSGAAVPGNGSGRGPVVSETTCPLNVGVAVEAEEGAGNVGELLGTYARGRLADLGYRAASGKDDDLTLELKVSCRVYDQTLNWWMHEGEVTAALKLRGGDAHLLGETSIAAQGARGRGEIQSQRNLSDELAAQLLGWMGRVLASGNIAFSAIRLDFALANPIVEAEDYKAIDEIQKGLAGLPGVRSAEVVAQDNDRGQVSLKVVYDNKLLPTGPWNKLLADHPELLENYLN